MIQIDRKSKTPLYEQVYNQIRQHIAAGIFPEDTRLPPIRTLAADLHCSKNTIETAYQMLIHEDVVESRVGSGFYVKAGSIQNLTTLDIPEGRVLATPVASHSAAAQDPIRYDFCYGDLQQGTFPTRAWKSILDDIMLNTQASGLTSYEDSAGIPELRAAIARNLMTERGMKCFPEQIIVQSGTQAALMNLLMLFDRDQDMIAMEEPGYSGARRAFELAGFKLTPARTWTPEGGELFMEDLKNSNAKLVYTTPSSQFPAGLTMTREMRLKLLTWAHVHDTFIIEDDYCCEYRYNAAPVPALFGLDKYDRVIYMGTFSKVLSPALRMNYLVLPPELVKRWNEVFVDAYPYTPWITQETLHRFLTSNHWNNHVRRMQGLGRRKYQALKKALADHMGDRITVLEGGAGLHLLVDVADGRSQAELIESAARNGVRIYETNKYWMAENHPLQSCVLVGFSSIVEEDIEPGIMALAEAWFN